MRIAYFLLVVMAGLLVMSGLNIAHADDNPATVDHEFQFKPDAGVDVKAVNLAGDFNGWSTTATPMLKAEDGTYAVTVKLTPGKHLYKFVLDGTKWINDPAADKSLDEDDGQQGKNSGVKIAADDKPPADQIDHAFTYKPADGSSPKSVNLAGTFNNWVTQNLPMTAAGDGSFTITIKLRPGTYHYKFIIDGTKWVNDPAADKSLDADDQNQGVNSGIVVK
jgi:cyclomaltodextrinase / maltogenic alpha-amylase / neopullulanase